MGDEVFLEAEDSDPGVLYAEDHPPFVFGKRRVHAPFREAAVVEADCVGFGKGGEPEGVFPVRWRRIASEDLPGFVVYGSVSAVQYNPEPAFGLARGPIEMSGEGAVFASPDGANYMALICFLNGSLAREAVRDLYDLDWSGFARMLAGSQPGNDGGLMLPYFSAEIVPHVSLPGVVRQGLRADDAAANVRAVIEAQALATRLHSRWMGVPVNSLSVTGGASENPQILQIYADIHNCPVHRFQTTNSAALGAALRARHGHLRMTGQERAEWKEIVAPFTQPAAGSTITPDPAVRSIYDRLENAYAELETRHTS